MTEFLGYLIQILFSLTWFLLKWFSGYPLNGRFRTNASWTQRGTNLQHPHPVTRWHYWPWLQRGAVRGGSTIVVLFVADEYARHRRGTLETLTVTGCVLALLAAWWMYRKVRYFRHHWKYVRPLRRRLTPMLEGAPPRLAIEPDRSEAKIYLPPEFVGTDREWQQIETAVTVTLGLESPEKHPQMQGNRPYVIYTRSEPPPARVVAADIRPAIQAAAEHMLIPGIGIKDKLIEVSVDVETPMLGMSMGTGDGKSSAAMNLAVQGLWHGWQVVILDYKLMSHMWARGLPNVAYAGTPEEIHAMLCWLAYDDKDADGNTIRTSEVTRRKEVALASADIRGNVTADLGPRTLVVAEELNTMIKKLKACWRRMGGKGPSPALEALEELIFTGRQLRMHLLMIGQRLSAKATSGGGDGDVRENLGTIFACDPTPATWRMLAGDHPQPPASGHKGRYQVITRKQVRAMQGALWDEEDARAFATSGTVAVPRHDMPFVTAPARVPLVVGQTPTSAIEAPEQPFVLGQAAFVPSRPPGAVTLQECVAAGLWPTKGAADKAAQRGKCGDHVGWDGPAKLYDLATIHDIRSRNGKAN